MRPQRISLRGTWDDSIRVVQAWMNDVQSILAGGTTLADQFGTVITTQWNSTRQTPISVSVRERPTAIICLSATVAGSSSVVSGVPLTWEWSTDGATVKITAATGLSAATDYSMVLLLVKG